MHNAEGIVEVSFGFPDENSNAEFTKFAVQLVRTGASEAMMREEVQRVVSNSGNYFKIFKREMCVSSQNQDIKSRQCHKGRKASNICITPFCYIVLQNICTIQCSVWPLFQKFTKNILEWIRLEDNNHISANCPACAWISAQCTLSLSSLWHENAFYEYFLACIGFQLHVHSL